MVGSLAHAALKVLLGRDPPKTAGEASLRQALGRRASGILQRDALGVCLSQITQAAWPRGLGY